MEELKKIIEDAFNEIRNHLAPNPNTRYITSTGNLAFNALKYSITQLDNGYDLHIWVDEEIAPYMVFTNEPWLHERWHGRSNPNEGWWQRINQYIRDQIARHYDVEWEQTGGQIYA